MEYASARRIFTFVLWIRRFVAKDFPLQYVGVLLVTASTGEKGETMGNLSRLLHMSQSSVSKACKFLSEWSSPDGEKHGKGLIELKQDMAERPRRIRLHLTDRGREVLEALESALADREQSLGEANLLAHGVEEVEK